MEIRQPPVHQGNRVLVAVISFRAHAHTDQLPAIPLHIGDQGMPGLIGIACLPSLTAIIEELACLVGGEHGMGIVEGRGLRVFVGWRDLIAPGPDHLANGLVLIGFSGNQGQVIGAGIVLIIVQAAGIDKMRIDAAQLLRPVVHGLNECIVISPHISAHMLRDRVGALIGGGEQHPVESLLHAHLLPHISGNVGAVGLVLENRVRGKGDGLVELAVLQGQQSRHQLGRRGRIAGRLILLAIKDLSAVQIHEDGGRRLDLRLLGPGRRCRLFLRINALWQGELSRGQKKSRCQNQNFPAVCRQSM